MKNFVRIFGITLSIATISAVGYGLTHTRDILDWLALRNYSPSARVVELADVTAMNAKTRKVFYVNKPDLQNKSTFKNSCTKQEETIVLGCYIQNTGIYLLSVDDPRLQGIVEVTAAHEVLHAMYDRLGEEERAYVDGLISESFAAINNKRIRENIENYRKKDPTVVPNELHSILATEVNDLSPSLEEYYGRYFTNRKAIVAFSQKYEQTFIDIEDQVKGYKEQLAALNQSLDANKRQLESLGQTIDAQRRRLDSLLAEERIDEYNAGIEPFNNVINQYNGLIKTIQDQISEYNRIVEIFNSLATEEANLIESLKTNPSLAQPRKN